MKPGDKRKNARVTKGTVFTMEMVDPPYLQKKLLEIMKGPDSKTILNGCCGSSPIGNVRYDIALNSNRTHIIDLKDQLKTFYKNQFNYYLIDPLDAFYNPYSKFILENYYKGTDKRGRKYGDPYQWQYDALTICDTALILQRPLIMTNWPKDLVKKVDYGLIRDSRPMGRILEVIWKK